MENQNQQLDAQVNLPFWRSRSILFVVIGIIVVIVVAAIIFMSRGTGSPETFSADGVENLTPLVPDADNDGLSDSEESAAGTDASKADTDADGLSDYDEVQVHGTDPRNAKSKDPTMTDRAWVIQQRTKK